MQIAIQNGNKILAWQAEKGASYLCPICQNEVILKAGKIREPHFAHKVDSDCPNRRGETELHLRIKREIFEDLSKQSNCYRCELERPLNGVRPDISLYINNQPIAIEIQRSDISITLIVQRTMRYTQMGISLLWLLPELKFNDEGISSVKAWHRFLHCLHVQRLYIWCSEAMIQPIHLEPKKVWIEEYEDWQSGQVYGGYEKDLKTRFYGNSIPPIHIAKNFSVIERCGFTTEEQYIPKSKLWQDTIGRWWIDEE